MQANKAGLLEVADVLVINKADRPGVKETARDLRLMLQLSASLDWTPPIVETVASTGVGIKELWDAISSHREYLEAQGQLELRRAERAREETVRITRGRFEAALCDAVASLLSSGLFVELEQKRIDPEMAADSLVALVAENLTMPGGPVG